MRLCVSDTPVERHNPVTCRSAATGRPLDECLSCALHLHHPPLLSTILHCCPPRGISSSASTWLLDNFALLFVT